MKKKIPIEKHKPKTQEYLIALFYFPSALKLVKPRNSQQESLIAWFLDKENHVADDSFDLPSIKELGSEMGVSNNVMSRLLKELYESIVELNFENPLLFKKPNEVLCYLVFSYQGNRAGFTISLTHLPHVGESFRFFFIMPLLGWSSFWVKRVYHEYDDGGQRVTLMLSADYPNAYLDLVKEKAFLKREITFAELINNEIDYQMQEKLLSLNKDHLL